MRKLFRKRNYQELFLKTGSSWGVFGSSVMIVMLCSLRREATVSLCFVKYWYSLLVQPPTPRMWSVMKSARRTVESNVTCLQELNEVTWFFWSAADGERMPLRGCNGRDVDENVVTGLEVKVFGSLDGQVGHTGR
jgi:hypothetical protein